MKTLNRFINCKIVTTNKVIEHGELVLNNGNFDYAGPIRKSGQLPKARDLRGAWVVPGFIDFQVNDAQLFQLAPDAAEAHRARLDRILETQIAHGVTALYLATVAQPIPVVKGLLSHMTAYMQQQTAHSGRSRLLGALVEGTFMNPECCGAHNPENVLRPSVALMQELVKTGAVRQLNVAPEWGIAALRVIRAAAAKGVLVAAGHTKCTAEELKAAVDNGTRYIIHVTNGPTGTLTKVFHDGGTLEGAMTDDRLCVSVIADGYHVHPRYIRDIIARKSYERVVIISDLMFADCKPVSPLDLNGIEIRVAGNGAYAYVAGRRTSQGYQKYPSTGAVTLGGNACWAMDSMFANTVHYLSSRMEGVWNRSHPALSLPEAVRQAAVMTATNPAHLGRLDTGKDRIGRIARGFAADFTIGRIQQSTQKTEYQIKEVYQQGIRVC